jgi:pimeloyl-ACP methyl ester carboxylesterase
VQYAKQLPQAGNDVVIVVPGVMGSRLQAQDGSEVWGAGAGSMLRALRTLGGSLRALMLPSSVGDGPAPDGVRARGLMPSLHAIPGIWTPIKGYSELQRFLLQPRFGLVEDRPEEADAAPGNLVFFSYDWRLSNRYSGQCLKERAELALERWRASDPSRADAQLVLICHSMGGLVARWYVEKLAGAAITRTVVTLGTPHRGACKALEQLVNGVRKGPLQTDLTAFARSLPSSYQLLPEYACLESATGGLKKTIDVDLPHLDKENVADGMRFHDELDGEEARNGYALVPVIGIGQPTWTTARIADEHLVPLETIEDRDLRGDGTVPRLSARPKRMTERDTAIRGVVEGHGLLTAHRSVSDQLDLLLTADDIVFRSRHVDEADEGLAMGISTPDVHETGEPVSVAVRFPAGRLMEVVVLDEQSRETARELVTTGVDQDDGLARGTATFAPLAPGGYVLAARAPDDPHGQHLTPVHTTTFVLP